MFNGLTIYVVEPGTVVRDKRTGQEVTVNNQTVARDGVRLVMTQKTFDALSAHTQESRDE